jgi:HPt (histidine-containing phosphotransfer) domain-containing protein
LEVDWSRIDSLADRKDPKDLEWLQEILQTLYENMVTRLDNVKKYSEQKDAKNLRAELHQIKGVTANFGLNNLHELVQSAEAEVKSGQLENSLKNYEKIAASWERAKSILKSEIPN